jgi:multidrug transporter EmrE-like cation transporter
MVDSVPPHVLTVLIASVAFGVGGSLLPASDGFTKPVASAGVLALFVLGAFLLARATRNEGLSQVYVLGLGLEAVVTLAIALVVMREHVSVVQVLGIASILGGVAALRAG